MSGSDEDRDVEIVPTQSSRKRPRLTLAPVSSPEEEEDLDDMDDEESDASKKALQWFNKGTLMELWRVGEHEEVGRREIVLTASLS